VRLLGPPLTDVEREAFVAAMLARVGKPWRHQGRTERGADCIGHVHLALATVRTHPVPRTDYGRTPHNDKLRTGLRDYLGEPVAGELRVGDIVSMRTAGAAHHVGVIVPHPDWGLGLVHGDSNAPGVAGMRVVYHGLDARWRSRIVEVFRP
jgi:cell wall-associated NlpC family hydrolase